MIFFFLLNFSSFGASRTLLVVSVFAVTCEFCIYLYSSVWANHIRLPLGKNRLNDYLGGRECKLLEVRCEDFSISRF